MVTQYQGNQLPGPVTKTQNNFTWSQDSLGNLFISSTVTTLDPGQTYSVQKRTDQNVDIYGNVLNVFQYDYGNLTTPSRIYTYTYLNSSAYTSLNIYNRMVSATVGVGQQNVITLATNAYDNNYVSPAPSGITNWDTSYATATARGNLTSFTSINNSGLTYYDQTGMPTSSNQNNVATTITGSASNNYAVPSQITVGSLTSSLNWSSFLGVTSATGPNGDAATISYDTSARPSTSTSPYGATTSYVYSTGPYTSSNPNTTTATTNSHWTKTILDGLGRTITAQTGTGTTTLSQVDTVYGSCGCSPTGKMIQQSLPHAPGGTPAWTTYTYDGIGRTVSVVAPDGASTTSYVYQGNTVKVTDPAGKYKTFTMDAFGHLTMVDEPNPGSSPPPAPVFPPTFSPAPGTYGASQTVTINSATSGATIRYTTDGSTPTETHGTVYSGSIAVSVNTSINAIAYETGMSDSAVSAVSYTINSGTTGTIAFDAQSTNFTADTNSFSFNHTVGTNSNRILVCGVLVNTPNSGNGISGISYAGVPMTLITATSTTYDPKTYWWLANPTSGTNSVTISGAGIYYNVYTSCASYSGASQTAPTNFTTSSQSSPITFTLTTSQNNDWVSAFFQNATGDTPTPGTGTTIRTSPNNGGGMADTGGPISPAGAASLHFTADGTLAGIIVDLVPASGGGSYPAPVAIPTFSAAPGTYGASQNVTLSSNTPSASIYYTTNGTAPSSTNGLLYSGSISVTATTTIQAIAYATGMATSEISTGAFTILPPSGGGDYLTYYTYDAWDNLSTVSMPRPSGTQTRTFTYNGTLLMSATNPENGTVSYTYNGYNKLQTKTDAKGQQFSYTYDTYARLIGVSVGGTQVETYTYDTTQNSTYPTFSQGRLTAVQYGNTAGAGASFLETYGYSQGGLKTNKGLQITQTFTEQDSNDNNSHTGPGTADLESVYAYDSEGRMTNIQYAGNNFTYGYDSMERLNTMTNTSNSQQIITGTTYDPANRLLSISGELTESRTYNGMGQLQNITSGWGSTSLNITYNYSSTQNNGKIISQTDAISGEQIQYTYDSLNRLATATASGISSPWGQSYTYDGFGNLLDQTVTAGTAPPLSVNYNAATNRQPTDCADANGNIEGFTNCGSGLYLYDYKNRINTVLNQGGGSTFYTYSPDNKRVWRSAVDYYGNPTLSEVAFWSVTGQKLFTCNLTPGLAVYQPSSQTWKETLSCPIAVTNTYFGAKLLSNGIGPVVQDSLGSIGKYYPWGQEKPSTTTNGTEKFTGYFRDSETGLDYASNRYHQPGMGRFLSDDPSGDNWDLTNPGSWNTYAYVNGDPINSTDLSGLASCGSIGVVGGGTLQSFVLSNTAQGHYIDLVWEEGGTLSQTENAGGDSTEWLDGFDDIAQAIWNRYQIVLGNVSVTGANGIVYSLNNGNVNQLGYLLRGLQANLNNILISAANGTGVLTGTGGLANTFGLMSDLNQDQGNFSYSATAGRTFALLGPDGYTGDFVTAECASVIQAFWAANTAPTGGLGINTATFFPTSWNSGNPNSPNYNAGIESYLERDGRTNIFGFSTWGAPTPRKPRKPRR
jgi:RHS repeat-associated protein